MIKGIYADEAHQLHPEQWVNVYHLDFMGRAIYHSTYTVGECATGNLAQGITNN